MKDGVVLVTGGAGYVGTHTSLYFLENTTQKVVVVDSFERSDPQFVTRLAKEYPDRLAVHQLQLEDRDALSEIMRQEKVTDVMHCAAYIDIPESVDQPKLYRQKIYENTRNLIWAMHRNDVRRIAFSSTAATYGSPRPDSVDAMGRITEEHPQIPSTVYGLYKLMSEAAMTQAFEDGLLDAVTFFRYFNVAGADPKGRVGEAHLKESHVLPLLILAALGVRDSFTIFGTELGTRDGTPARDMIHVLDLADAHKRGIEGMQEGNLAGINVFNLGNVYKDAGKVGVTVREMVDAVRARMPEKFRRFKVEEKLELRSAGEPEVLCASSDKAVKELGWNPNFNLDDIVTTAIAWHSKLAAQGWYRAHEIGKDAF